MELRGRHLDDTLKLLYKTTEWYLELKDVHNALKVEYPEMIIREALQILDKLVRDGYVQREVAIVTSSSGVKREVDKYYITFEGREFVERGGYKELKGRKLRQQVYEAEKEGWEKQLILDTLKTNQSVTQTNRISTINVYATIVFGFVVTTATVMTCFREMKKDHREERQEIQDSIKQSQQSRHDSLYEKYLIRKAKEDATFSKIDTTKQ